jgi:periplasmic copper chaperone A
MNSILRLALALAALWLASGCGSALPAAPGSASGAPAIAVEGLWARPATLMDHGMDHTAAGEGQEGTPGHTMDAGSTSAVYMTLVNSGGSADALLGARTDAARAVELHATELENNVARMRPVQQIDIPAGGSAELKPGGFHMMLVGITRELKPGETVALTLLFQSGRTIAVAAPVRERAP